jgi:hypothetical protein
MERMFAGVIIVQDDFHDLALLEDESVSIAAVYCGVRSSISGGENGVESGDLGRDISDVVEEGTGTVFSTSTP